MILHGKDREEFIEQFYGFKPRWICPYLEIEIEIYSDTSKNINMNCYNVPNVISDKEYNVIVTSRPISCNYQCVK